MIGAQACRVDPLSPPRAISSYDPVMRRALVMLVVAICGGCSTPRAAPKQEVTAPAPTASEAPPSSPPPRVESPPAPAASEEACASLTRTACMQSTECTLEPESAQPSHRYRCRPATEPCERGFAQASFTEVQQAACNARAGCGFVPGSCYCHCRGLGQTTVPDGDEAEPCKCKCAGGPPSTCRALQ